MPLEIIALDTAYPPIWLQSYSTSKTLGGVPVAVGGELNPSITPVTDDNSSLRKTDGHDYQNYLIRQRIEGDLFHRDMLIADALDRIINYLGQRTGLVFSIPEVLIAPTKTVTIGYLDDRATSLLAYTGLFITAARCYKTTDSGNCGIRVVGTVSGNETVLYTTPASGTIFTTGALSVSNRGTQITSTATAVRIEAFNDHASSNAQLNGFISVAANTV